MLETILTSAKSIKNEAKTVLIVPMGVILTLAMAVVPATADIALIAVLNSNQEVQDPKPTSNAVGNAVMTFTISTSMLCYSMSHTALDGAETAAHFHGPATAGENAAVLFNISPDPSPVGSPKTGCVGPLTDEEAKDLSRGFFYINIHSDLFPSGEIRGQVYRVRAIQTADETVADTD